MHVRNRHVKCTAHKHAKHTHTVITHTYAHAHANTCIQTHTERKKDGQACIHASHAQAQPLTSQTHTQTHTKHNVRS